MLAQLALLALTVPAPGPRVLTVFEAVGCSECARTEREVLAPLELELGQSIRIERRSIEDPNVYEALIRLEARFEVPPERRALPVVLAGDRLLIGHRRIASELRSLVLEGRTSTTALAIDSGSICEDASCRPGAPIWMAYFHQPGCRACSRVEADLRHLRARHPRVIVETMSSYDRLPLGRWVAARVGRELATPSVFVGQHALIGERELSMARLEELVRSYDGGAEPFWHHAPEEVLRREASSRFRSLGPAAIVIAGLLDGINPCAFATLIFLVSYLAATGRRGRQVLLVGVSFTAGVFIAYLAVGLGMHRAIDALSEWVSELGRWLLLITGAICAVLAVWSITDYTKARRGRVEEMSLVLPEALEKRIRTVIRTSARTETYVLAAFAAGLVVSLLELACTGQIYLPTIVFMTSIPELEAKAIAYLVLYNLMFIAPLIAVFVLVYFGSTSRQLTVLLHRHAASVKLAFAAFLGALAAWLLITAW